MSYKRVLLKLSGEALMGAQAFGLSHEVCGRIAYSISGVVKKGVQVGIVIGGGNIFRGIQGAAQGMQRIPADQIGMLATLINSLTVNQCLHAVGCPSQVFSALPSSIVENYDWQKVIECMQKGKVAIMAGGTGLPYFSTDTAAALRAVEIQADILLKATKVDGIYDKDPVKHSDAKRYSKLSYHQILTQNLQVMDATATALCSEHNLPILVFDIFAESSLEKAIFTTGFGTLVTPATLLKK